MSAGGFFSGFPLWTRLLLSMLVTLLLIPSILVAAPAVMTAIRQGRPVTIGPVSIGQFEHPAVRNCKLVLDDTNEALRSLQQQLSTLSELMKSQSSEAQKLISDLNKFLQTTQEVQKSQYYRFEYIEGRMDSSVNGFLADINFTKNELARVVNGSINTLNKIRDYCLNFNPGKN